MRPHLIKVGYIPRVPVEAAEAVPEDAANAVTEEAADAVIWKSDQP